MAGNSLFVFERDRGGLTAVKAPGPGLRALGLLRDGTLCVQQADGESPCSLHRFDGRGFERLAEPAAPVAMGTNLTVLFAAQDGDLWLGGSLGIASLHDRTWRSFVAPDKTAPEVVSHFVELPDGRLWCATPSEVWESDGKNWSVVRRGFDTVSDMVRTRDGSVWVASNSGLHRFVRGAWVENGLPEGLPSMAVRNLCEEPRGTLGRRDPRPEFLLLRCRPGHRTTRNANPKNGGLREQPVGRQRQPRLWR